MTASSAMTSSPRQAWASAHQLGAIDTDSAIEAYTEIDIPQSLRDNLALFLRLERRVLQEYDPAICELFDKLLNSGPSPMRPVRRRSVMRSSLSTSSRTTRRRW